MKKKAPKITLKRETLRRLEPEQIRGAVQAEAEDDTLCISILCMSVPESVCLCSGGTIAN